MAEDPRADDGHGGGDHREAGHGVAEQPVHQEAVEHAAERALEVTRLLVVHRAPRSRSAAAHDVASSSVSWDRTISRYTSHVSISSSCVPVPTTRPTSRTTIRS